jgi:hypothetical protein
MPIMASMTESLSKPRLRSLRFSLRFLMLLVVVLAIPMAWKVNRAQNQRRVMAELGPLHPRVLYDYQTSRINGVVTASTSAQPPGPAWLRKFLGDEYFVDIFQLMIDGPGVNDKTLALISTLPRLESVGLTNTAEISDDGLIHLAGMQSLEFLTLFSDRITGKGIAHLAGPKRLKKLWVSGQVTDDYLQQVSKLENLELLHVYGVDQITDSGLAQVAKLTKLRSLNLGDGGWFDSGVQDCMKVTDQGLENLHALKNLKDLELNTTEASRAGVEKLRNALPNCKVLWSLNGPDDSTTPATGGSPQAQMK